MCLAVGDPCPGMGRVGIVGISLGIQMVEKHIHLIGGQQLSWFHVVVCQSRVVALWVLPIEHSVMCHPARLVGGHLHHLFKNTPKVLGS